MKMRMRYKMLPPVSHIGETASSGSYFQTVLTSFGRVPVITGNSIRGQLRDSMALHLLDLLDVKVSKETFHILFSGGNINGTMKDDVEKAKKIREAFPSISLLGGGLGDMIMSGKMISSFAYPICRETEEITGIYSELSWHSLIDEMEFTRTDDSKNDKLSGHILDPEAEKRKPPRRCDSACSTWRRGPSLCRILYSFLGLRRLKWEHFTPALRSGLRPQSWVGCPLKDSGCLMRNWIMGRFRSSRARSVFRILPAP